MRRRESVAAGVRRIAREQVDAAFVEIREPVPEPEVTVHQLRKRCKKIRAVLRLVRTACPDTYRRENAWYRDTARGLAGTREAQVMVATFDRVVAGDRDLLRRHAAVRAALVAERDAGGFDAETVRQRLVVLEVPLGLARARVRDWTLDARGFDAIAGGLALTYRRGRQALEAVRRQPTPERLHEWRKRVGYHWYHLRLLADTWPVVTRAYRRELHRLSELLGDDHDRVLLRTALLGRPERFGTGAALVPLLDRMDAQRAALRADAHLLGGRVYAERPARLVARHRRWWSVWRGHGDRRDARAAAHGRRRA